jgi:hypothetical protein|tara:strand:+ start:28 stop:213 length:186 start_codon:yes stop_codon:yes gene_type:complete
LPAENPYSEAIFSVIQEYQQHRKDAKKSAVPKVRAKAASDIDPVVQALESLGLNVAELRGV